MAFPTVQARNANAAAANATTLTAALPASIARGDLIIVAIARDGTGAMTYGSGMAGWHSLLDANDTGTAACKMLLLYRIAEGTESGNLSLTSPTENWTARTWRITGYDPNTPPAVATAGDGGTGSTNPNPPSLNPADWGTEDTLWIAFAAGDGNVAFTAGPGSYGNTSFQITTDGTTGNRCAHGAAERELNAASEDPGTFTRGSEDWLAATIGVRPAPTPHAIPILRSKTFYNSGATSYNNSFTLDAGTAGNRRMFIAVGGESAASPLLTIDSVTYGGVSASLVTDGTDTANAAQTDTFTGRCTWWEIKEADLPADGSNTLTVGISKSAEITTTVVVVEGADQGATVAEVTNNNSAGATSLTTNPVCVDDCLVLNFAYVNGTTPPSSTTIAGFQAVGRGSCEQPTDGCIMTVAAKGLTTQTGAQAVTVTATASVRFAMSTIVIAPAPASSFTPRTASFMPFFGA